MYFLKSSRDSGEPHLPRSRFFLPLVLPESVKPVRCKLGVPHRVLDVLMSQVVLLDANYQEHKIRLAGIDAPERKQAYGLASRKALGFDSCR